MGIFDWLFGGKKLKKEYHDNSVLSAEYEVINGKKNGYYKDYYKSGALKVETRFKDDLMSGKCKFYFENGNLSELSWHNKGEPALGSIWERYLENGELEEKIEISKKRNVSKKGNPFEFVELLIYRKPDETKVKVFKEYFNDGTLSYEVQLIDGKKVGYYKDYYESGALKIEANYQNDLLDGECKFYYENGNINEKSNYKNGKPTGVWEWYYESGDFMKKKFIDIEFDFDAEGNVFTRTKTNNEKKETVVKTLMKQNMLQPSKLEYEKQIEKKGSKSLNFKLDISEFPESTIKDINAFDDEKKKQLLEATIFIDKDGVFDESKGQAKTIIESLGFISKINGIKEGEVVFDIATFLRMGDEFPPVSDKDGKWYVKFGNMIQKSFSDKKFKTALKELLKVNNIEKKDAQISINSNNGSVIEIYEGDGFNIQFILGVYTGNSDDGQLLYEPPKNKNVSNIIQIINQKELQKQSLSYIHIEGKGLYNL